MAATRVVAADDASAASAATAPTAASVAVDAQCEAREAQCRIQLLRIEIAANPQFSAGRIDDQFAVGIDLSQAR